MTAKEYADKHFGSVVYFDVVEQDKREYAKVFAQGSSALEALLLNLWSKGAKTFACGNDHVLIGPEADRLDFERRIQGKFDDYMRSSGVRRFLKGLHKDDVVPFHSAYVSIDPASLPAAAELGESLKAAMSPFAKECKFVIAEPPIGSMGDVRSFGLYFKVSREDELRGRVLAEMSDDEIIQSSLPPADLFDKYFEVVNRVFEEHFQKHNIRVGSLGDIDDVGLVDDNRQDDFRGRDMVDTFELSELEQSFRKSLDEVLEGAKLRSEASQGERIKDKVERDFSMNI